MILQTIRLENIRSYQEAEITFPSGSVLLSGDVGAGKSTLLLAVDFALFGLQKGNLTGDALLRKGAKKGSVEVCFSLENKKVSIKRGLHRGTSIAQESVLLTINGEAQRLTPLELKQRVLQLLNYPQDLLTKSKSLIYRYTVYTPQEEMKSILLGESEIRLDTLRKIFGIDKYKRVRENSKIYISYLKDNKKHFEGMLLDYETKREHLKNISQQLTHLETQEKNLLPEKEQLQLQEIEHQQVLTTLENQIKQHHESQQLLSHLNAQLLEKIGQRKELAQQLEALSKQLTTPPPTLVHFDEKQLQKLGELHTLLQEKCKAQELACTQARITIANSKKTISDISSLANCPLCKQEVHETHKTSILSEEEQKITLYSQKLQESEMLLEEAQKQCADNDLKLEQLRKVKNSQELIRLQHEQYTERVQRRELLESNISLLKQEVGDINMRKASLEKNLLAAETSQELLQKKKKILQEITQKLRSVELELMRAATQIQELTRQKESLHQELLVKEQAQLKLQTIKELHQWIESSFIPSLEKMEQQVLLKIHADFNDFYKKWFITLMGSEELLTRLDEQFTPVVEQNGHVVDYLHLSGGEKTAVALAYRLALNQVINNLMVDIKTHDVIILDEPTDGFSHEQVERIQVVLEELKVKQVIIVSHEPKIEGFVDHILRVEKNDHTSFVKSVRNY